jgi:hypothetical protein
VYGLGCRVEGLGLSWVGSIANPLDRKTFAIAPIAPPIAALVGIRRQGYTTRPSATSPHRSHRSHSRTESTDRISDGIQNSVAVETPVLDLVHINARKRIPKRHGGETAISGENPSVGLDERIQGLGVRAKGSRGPPGGGSLCHRPIGFRV